MPRPTRTKFLRLMTELREAAKVGGETALAEAANECLRNATTNPQCPMGRLLLAEHPQRPHTARTDTASPDRKPRAPFPPDFIARHSHADIVHGLHALMKSNALQSADLPMFQALRQCDRFIQATEPNFCPFRRLLRSASTPPTPSRKSTKPHSKGTT